MVKNAMAVSLAALLILLLSAGYIMAGPETPTQNVSAELGKIKTGAKPPGRIAFLNEGDVWIMDTDGKNRQKVCAAGNARGRVSFSPDNKVIAFARRGKEASNLPSGEGGAHMLNDIFLAFVDSASVNTNWWNRITFGLGASSPEWSQDGTEIFCQNDANAGLVDYLVPNYQMSRVNAGGGQEEFLRKDWQTLKTLMTMPTVTGNKQKVAYAIRYNTDPTKEYAFQNAGVKIVNMSDIMQPESEMRKASAGLKTATAPSWSPDGQWLAYISNDLRNPGLYIVKHDLSDRRMVFAPSATQQLTVNPVGWSPNSQWMVFATGDGTIYTIDINGDHLTPITGSGSNGYPAWSK
ncbi:MAG: hypothetical protein GY841_10050 [FCB group bacterium]|nr:hypothetical protein [FCB group bacterium]